MTAPRIVFAGTPEFALASLQALVNAGHHIVAAYTQPDRPAGRGRKLKASPVKRYAEKMGIDVQQPVSFRETDTTATLSKLRPDVMIVAAYGLLLPQTVLDLPTHGCLNVHASILPRWRGAAPIQAAILAGDESTGISLMRMNVGLDTGPVFGASRVQIGADETAGELQDRLARLGGDLLVADLEKILSGEIKANDQDETLMTYAAKVSKKDANLDWSLPATELSRRVRAYNPVPGAFFHSRTDEQPVRVKVWQCSVVVGVDATPGTIVQYDADGVVFACGRDGLRLDSMQAPGKRRATAREFVDQIDLV